MPRGLFSLFLLGAGCPGSGKDGEALDTGLASGDAEACLEGSADAGGETLAISATVLADDAATLACARAGGRSLALTDSNDNDWTLGYALWDLDGADITAPLDLDVGDTVTVLVRRDPSGEPFGFVVTDDQSIVAALAVGRGGLGLEDGDVPDLQVSDGELLARANTTCGELVSRELVFSGDATITLSPYEDRLITVSATAYTATALRNTSYEAGDPCADGHADELWAIWR